LAVCFNPLAAMLRRSSDAGGIDQGIADRPLGSVPIAARPSRGYRCRLRGEAVFGDQAVVARKEARIEGQAGAQRIDRLLAGFANSGGQQDTTVTSPGCRPTRRAPSAKWLLIRVAVARVLRVRMMPSAISPHRAAIFGNTADT
jgi:hypothetical protein